MAAPLSVGQMRFSISNARLHANRGELADSIVNYLAVLRTLGSDIRRRYIEEFLDALQNYIRWETNRTRVREVLNAASTLYEDNFGVLRISAEWLYSEGEFLMSLDKFKQAMTVAEAQQQWLHAVVSVENVKSTLVDAWHWRMINDERRNQAFSEAIQRASRQLEGGHLLDIGAGSGIFSVVASRYCDTVSACECDPVMYDVAHHVFELNNVNVRLYKTHSRKLNLSSSVDIVVSETVDSGLFGERIVSTMIDAHNRLLAPSHVVIPQKATVLFSLVEALDVARDHYFEVNDNVLVSQGCYTSGTSHESLPTSPYSCTFLNELPSGYRLLSEPVVGLSIDFDNIPQLTLFVKDKFVTEVVLQADKEGTAHAVAAWFRLQVYDDIELCTDPEENLCWQQVVFPFYPPRRVAPADKLRFEVFVRDEKLHVNPSGPPPEKQILKGPELDFKAMHDEKIREFFRNALREGDFRHALDCTDLLIQDGSLEMPVSVASKRSSIRYVSDNAINLHKACGEPGGAILHWPMTIQGVDDDYMVSIIETHIRSSGSAVLIPSDVILMGCLVSSEEQFHRSQISQRKSVHLGVDLHPMSAYQASYFHEIETRKLQYERVSESTELLRLNFSNVEWDLKQLCRIREPACLPVTRTGDAHALLYWYEVADGASTQLNLLDGSGLASAFIFPEPRQVVTGTSQGFHVSLHHGNVVFHFDDIML